METLFPKDYEKANLSKKRKLIRQMKQDTEITALSIALHAHEIYDYLKKEGVANPNKVFVEAFQYASTTLGIPYDLIDEAFFTQSPLTEEKLFEFSYLFNPEAKNLKKGDMPKIPITIDFYSIICLLLKELPDSFWEQFRKEDSFTLDFPLQSYRLEFLLQGFLQEVWNKTKEQVISQSEKAIEEARQMFLAYFYSNNQKYYRKETQKILLEEIEKVICKQKTREFMPNKEIIALLEKGDSLAVSTYVYEHLFDWLKKENYQRFLKSITKTKNLSLMNRLLVLYQRVEAMETKEVHDWINENRRLKETAKPLFLFGETTPKIDFETGEILQKRNVLAGHEQLPIVPYFEKKDTEGIEQTEKERISLSNLFVTLEKMMQGVVSFEQIETSYVENDTIYLKSGQSEKQVVEDFIYCFVRKEKKEVTSINELENQSITYIIQSFFGLTPLMIDTNLLENFCKLENANTKLQELFEQILRRSEDFFVRFEQQLVEQKIEKVRPTLEEEIQKACELHRVALATLATEKENKSEKKAENTPTMEEYLQKVKATSEGESDGKNT